MFYKKKKRFFKGKPCKVNGKPEIHPHYIVGEEDNNYLSFGITHSAKRGKHKNYKMKKNPDKNDLNNSYIRKRLVKDKKVKYVNKYSDYKMCKQDDKYISYLIGKKLKK